ncbi:helix-turn-helix domain-containing protein [Kitasatospora nipponensis]|uniref:Helix-turn-helix domain-containing protein n=1 Tax=Kitasatospora nipponensis TaxID=258049 RepID=A0ABP4H132_9ACTN
MAHLLEPVGLSADDSAVYRHLLDHVGAPAAEVARTLALPAQTVDACLRRLTAAGLCNRLAGPLDRHVAAPPDIALETLVLDRQQALDRLRTQGRELAVRAKTAAARPGSLIETVDGQDAVLALIAGLELGARQEVCIVDSPPYLVGAVENTNELQALARGVRYRAIYHAPALAEPGRTAALERYIAAGEQARSLPRAHLKMLIVDRQQALLPLSFTSTDATSRLLVAPSPLLDALLIAFESLWNQATPLGTVAGRGAVTGGVEPRDREILRLMAAGVKDRAIARALGIGERTVMRRIQALMAELNAATRFQAGARAIRSGWLDSPARAEGPPGGPAGEGTVRERPVWPDPVRAGGGPGPRR